MVVHIDHAIPRSGEAVSESMLRVRPAFASHGQGSGPGKIQQPLEVDGMRVLIEERVQQFSLPCFDLESDG